MTKSIYLCGFMGCGKTTVGKVLAKRMDMQFVDLDEYLIEQENMSIPEIFVKHGEAHFRRLEAKYIKLLKDGFVVATGGGAIINKSTAEYARKSGKVIFIDTDFNLCYERIKGDNNRPLVMKNTKEQLLDLYHLRKPIYQKHSEIIINGNDVINTIVDRIILEIQD